MRLFIGIGGNRGQTVGRTTTRRDTNRAVSAAMPPRSIGPVIALCVLLASASSCAEGPSDVRIPLRPVDPYVGRATELFDDGIEALTAGYTNDVPEADANVVLRDRIQSADTVIRARVVTLTSREQGGWLVGVRPLQTLAGARPAGEIVLFVDANDRAVGLLRALEDRFVGMTIIAFLRTFSRAADAHDLHFHIAADTPTELQAIHSAILLAEVH